MGYQVVAAQLARLSGALGTSDHASVVSITLFVALLCACIVLGHLLEENRWLNESITALIIGLCTGVVILMTTKGKSSHVLVFSEDLFFIYLLPPIIFNAGPGKSIGISSILLGLVLVGRAAFVFPLSFLSNLTKKTELEKISWRQQLFGILTKPLIRFLLPASSNGAASDPASPKSLHSPLLTSQLGSDLEAPLPIVRPSSLRMLITKPTHTIHYYWRKFDDALMRPMFGGRGFVPYSPGSPTDPNVLVE
ncbi:Sodium/hydrogen exchanger 2 [Triticum urartu]|uniref:Sodium/hydrogen exchanger n=2 Tax=Triticum TaxID=4564 RepID=A0A9R1PFP0_TRITD|nr:Sodium/hydrogen exchanger 2 [Triticum urartu]VAH26782.1 unnamed protein product [Triticum turgidum subsp. durum]VAH42582.1 unnamed protein product [Triticum turgidum subsp. durum]